jgi:hypothetical protein
MRYLILSACLILGLDSMALAASYTQPTNHLVQRVAQCRPSGETECGRPNMCAHGVPVRNCITNIACQTRCGPWVCRAYCP